MFSDGAARCLGCDAYAAAQAQRLNNKSRLAKAIARRGGVFACCKRGSTTRVWECRLGPQFGFLLLSNNRKSALFTQAFNFGGPIDGAMSALKNLYTYSTYFFPQHFAYQSKDSDFVKRVGDDGPLQGSCLTARLHPPACEERILLVGTVCYKWARCSCQRNYVSAARMCRLHTLVYDAL